MEAPLRHFENKLAFETDSWDLHVALEAGENVVVVDARSPQAYQREHIPGAINIPHRTMNQETTKQIDKTSLVVTYCDGIGCNASTKGALNMTKLGFRVKELMGGLDWWKRDGYKTKGSTVGTKRKRVATNRRRRITRRSTGRAKAAHR
jgi:rhodanese-related sulfurtransferase